MRLRLAALAAGLLLAGPAGALASPAAVGADLCPPPGDVDDALAAVARVDVPGARGSGVLVDGDTVITAAHVVRDAATVRLRWGGGATASASVAAVDRPADLAVLTLSQPTAACPLDLAPVDADVGDAVHAAGYARGRDELAVTDGVVTARRQHGATRLLQTDAAVRRGMSGGLVLDDDLRVAGIIHARHVATPDVGFAVATSHVAALLAGDPAAAEAAPAPAGEPADADPTGLPPAWLGLATLLAALAVLAAWRRRRGAAGPARPAATGPGGAGWSRPGPTAASSHPGPPAPPSRPRPTPPVRPLAGEGRPGAAGADPPIATSRGEPDPPPKPTIY